MKYYNQYLDDWIKEITNKLNRKKASILFSEHAAKDKNLNNDDVDNVITTIRFGKIDKNKSTKEKERICFKNYFKDSKNTYFVITEYYSDFIKIITVIKKQGKY